VTPLQGLAASIRDLQAKYKHAELASAEDVMDVAVVPLFQLLDNRWSETGSSSVMGPEVKRPVWWSPNRRQELARLLQVRCSYASLCEACHLAVCARHFRRRATFLGFGNCMAALLVARAASGCRGPSRERVTSCATAR
jgi:hypothetical protein